MNNSIQKILRYPSLLRVLLEHPGQTYTPHQLGKITGIPYSTVWRYVRELRDFGVISITKLGKYNECRLNEASPLISKLTNIVALELASQPDGKEI